MKLILIKITILLTMLLAAMESICQAFPDSSLIISIDFNDSITDRTHNSTPSYKGGKFVQGKCGIIKSALKFDGTNDHVNLGKVKILTDSLKSFSISFWMKQHISEPQDYESIMGSFNTGSKTALDLKVHHGAGNKFVKNGISLQLRDENNKYFTLTINNNDSLFDGAWHHIVFNVTNTSTDTGAVYIDNHKASLASTTNTKPSNFKAFQYDFYVGATNNRGTIGRHFTGQLDDLKFYSRPLDSSEIDTLFKQRCASHSLVNDTNRIVIYDTTNVFDTTQIIKIDTFYRIINVYDTITDFDTIITYDTITFNRFDTIPVFDTTTTIVIDTFYNVITLQDTIYTIVNVFDTTTIVEYDTIHKIEFINVFDTITTFKVDTTTFILIEYDTTYIQVYDTIFINQFDTIQILDTNITTNVMDSCKSLLFNTGNGCQVKIFPNPSFSNRLIVSDLCTNETWDKVEIVNSIGQIFFLHTGPYSNYLEVSLKAIPNGSYYLNIYKGDFLVKSSKIINLK